MHGRTPLAALLLCALLAPEARAYIDPGSGSMLFQLAAAGFFGALYALRRYWQNIRGFFGARSEREPSVDRRP